VVTVLALVCSIAVARTGLLFGALLQLGVLTLGLLVRVSASLIAELFRLQVVLAGVLLGRVESRVLNRAQLLRALVEERVHVVGPPH
jgi:hypothetical protein